MPNQDLGVTPAKVSKLESIRNSNRNMHSNSGMLSFPSRPYAHSFLMVFEEYQYTPLGKYGVLSPKVEAKTGRAVSSSLRGSSAIELPFPTSLLDETALNVGPFERSMVAENIANKLAPFINSNNEADLKTTLNNIGAGVQNTLSSFMSSVDAQGGFGESATNLVKSAAQGLLGTQTGDIISGASFLLRSYAPNLFGGTVGSTIDNVTGQTINPRMTLAFQGVQLKNHNLSWQLFPENQKDSDIIRNIISQLKISSLPAVQDLPGINRAFLKYPSIVKPYLLGVNPGYWFQFKPCMISSVSVDFGGGGIVSVIKGGKPTAVTISIQLMELEIHTQEDYTGGGASIAGPQGATIDQQLQQMDSSVTSFLGGFGGPPAKTSSTTVIPPNGR